MLFKSIPHNENFTLNLRNAFEQWILASDKEKNSTLSLSLHLYVIFYELALCIDNDDKTFMNVNIFNVILVLYRYIYSHANILNQHAFKLLMSPTF